MLSPPRHAIVLTALFAAAAAADDWPSVPRRLPPAGIEIAAEQLAALRERLERAERLVDALADHPLQPDAAILTKAVRLAVDHGEFYRPQDAASADRLLGLAEQRCAALSRGEAPWNAASGRVVRGYRSDIDGSPQPYGLEIPAALDRARPAPLYVWLHGRGDKTTDLHFLVQRLDRPGRIAPPQAIVAHPFGRQCIGFKSAGEIDVLDVVKHVQARYRIDPDRVVLMGFSMGGAGAWHLGAHYADHWAAVAPGAGFAETARYNRLAPDAYPSAVEQLLWGQYDVPNYVRNLFHLPVVAYSGENDKQIQAARVMEEAFAAEGRELPHLIGPGMGHQYHPDTLAELMRRMQQAASVGRARRPQRVSLQTRTLRYSRQHWVQALGLERHWHDARIDAEIVGQRRLKVATKNVTRLKLSPWLPMRGVAIEIDGQTLTAEQAAPDGSAELLRVDGRWQAFDGRPDERRKRPGLQGPIDDAFLAPFLVVLPSGSCRHPAVQRWVDFELPHFQARWRALYRGELRVKRDTDVTSDDLSRFHVVLWGDSQANAVLKKVEQAGTLPWQWDERQIVIGRYKAASRSHVPLAIFPNPLAPSRYVVLNSGPTFRESHDRTNSLQNPKLGDWALVDVRQAPDGESPGKVLAHGLFNEAWQIAD